MPNFSESICCSEKDLAEGALQPKIQQSIADEYEASFRYRSLANATVNPAVKKLMNSIADEELVHAGEFRALLNKLFPSQKELEDKGTAEAEKIIVNDEEGKVCERCHKDPCECANDPVADENSDKQPGSKSDAPENAARTKKIKVVRIIKKD